MASLATHFSAFLFFFPVGVRRLLSSSSLYLKNPSHYRSKIWYFSEPRWKNLDFYILIVALPIASFSEFFLFLSFSGHPTYRFGFFHQALAVLFVWALLILIIIQEYFGTSFISERMVFKGTWLLQSGLSLYTDAFGLKGCQKISLASSLGDVDVKCDLDEDTLRGITLMHFLFTVHAILVMIFSVGLFGLLASNRNLRWGEGRGPLLAELESPTMLMRALPEPELE